MSGSRKKKTAKEINYRELTIKLLKSQRTERISEIVKSVRGKGLLAAECVLDDPRNLINLHPEYRAPNPGRRRQLDHDISNYQEFHRVPVYCDVKDEILPDPRRFTYITRNEISGFDDPVGNDALMIKCTCTGACGENCECIRFCDKLNNKTLKVDDGGALRIANPVDDIYTHALVVCGEHCSCGPECKRRIGNLVRNFRFEVYRMNRWAGFGVRTLSDVAFGELVMQFVGEVVPTDEIPRRALGEEYALEIASGEEQQLMRKAIALIKGLKSYKGRVAAGHAHIDGSERGNLSRFILNGCWPNLQPIRVIENHIAPHRHKLFFYALHDIPAGMQLTFFYGKGYMENRSFDCQCRTLLCAHGRWFRFLKTFKRREIEKVIANIHLVWKELVEEGRMREAEASESRLRVKEEEDRHFSDEVEPTPHGRNRSRHIAKRERQEKIALIDLTGDEDEPRLWEELEADSDYSGDEGVAYGQETGILGADEEPVPPTFYEEDADLQPQDEPDFGLTDCVGKQYKDRSGGDEQPLLRGRDGEDALQEADEPEPIEDEVAPRFHREDRLQERDRRGHMNEPNVVAGPKRNGWTLSEKERRARREGHDELEGVHLNEKSSADEVRRPAPVDPALEWHPHGARARLREVALLPARRAFPDRDPYTLACYASWRPPAVAAGNLAERARLDGHLQRSREESPEYKHSDRGRKRTREESDHQQGGGRLQENDINVVSISHEPPPPTNQQLQKPRDPSSSGRCFRDDHHQRQMRPLPDSRQSSRGTVTALRGHAERTVSRERYEGHAAYWQSPDEPLPQWSPPPPPEYRPTSPEYPPLEDEDMEEYRPSSPPILLAPSIESRRIVDQFHFESIAQEDQRHRRGERGSFGDRSRRGEEEWRDGSTTQNGQRQRRLEGGEDRGWNEMEHQLRGALPVIQGVQQQLGDEEERDEICRWGERVNQFRSGSPTVIQGVQHQRGQGQRGRVERRRVEREPYQPPKRRAVDYDYDGSSNSRRLPPRREQDGRVRHDGGLQDVRQPYFPLSPEILRQPSPEPLEGIHSGWRPNVYFSPGCARIERGEEQHQRWDEGDRLHEEQRGSFSEGRRLGYY